MKRRILAGIPFFPALLWLGMMLLLSGQSGAETTALSSGLAEWLQKYIFTNVRVETLHVILRKAAHVLVYLVEAVLWTVPLSKRHSLARSMILVFLGCSVLAVADEVMKGYIPGRHCDLREAGLNIAGTFFGVLVGVGIRLLLRHVFR